MSRVKIFVEPKDNETWDAICNKVYNGTIKRIDFKGVEFEKVKHGYWTEEHFSTTYAGSYTANICSYCGYQHPLFKTNYCPNCGAKMDEVKNEID